MNECSRSPTRIEPQPLHMKKWAVRITDYDGP
jgi:hypothetical protein